MTEFDFWLEPEHILTAQGKPPTPWQKDILRSRDSLILNCCRSAGKTTVVATKCAHRCEFHANSLCLSVSRTQRQAAEVVRKAKEAHQAMRSKQKFISETALSLEWENGSRFISLPSKEDTVRTYNGVHLLVIDEGARVPDSLFIAVSSMIESPDAHGNRGQLLLLSTPFGKRGFFWKEWFKTNEGEPAIEWNQFEDQSKWKFEGGWKKYLVSADECTRVYNDANKKKLRQRYGIAWYMQELYNSFEHVEGLVYPEFDTCIIDRDRRDHKEHFDIIAKSEGPRIGGIDWGWNHPFAAIYGFYHRPSDTIYITGERVKRQCPVAVHKTKLMELAPKTTWAPDPSEPAWISECRVAGMEMRTWRGMNNVTLGITAVNSRIKLKRIRFVKHTLPNLIAKAHLYRYPTEDEVAQNPKIDQEKPLKIDDDEMDALRYLVAFQDRHHIADERELIELAGPDDPIIIENKKEAAQAAYLESDRPDLWHGDID